MQLGNAWDFIKPFLEFGIVGVLLWMTLKDRGKLGAKLTHVLEQQVLNEKEHGKEILAVERGCNKQIIELAKQMDMTMATVENTLESLGGKIDELTEEQP